MSSQQLERVPVNVHEPAKNRANLEQIMGRDRYLDAVQKMLPKHMDAEKLQKQVFIAANKNPKIYECTVFSIMQSVTKAAELGLDCSGNNGEGYLVPYGAECQFIPGYRGLAKLYRNATGGNIESRVVYEGDEFYYEFGLDKKCKHIPNPDRPKNAIPTHFYAIVRNPDLEPEFDVMTKAEVDAIRGRSRSANKGPWVTDYTEMGKKTVVRRLLKYQASSPELQKALEADDAQYPALAIEAGNPTAGVSGMKDRMKVLNGDDIDTQLAQDAAGLSDPMPAEPETDVPVNEETESVSEDVPTAAPPVDPKASKKLEWIDSINNKLTELTGGNAAKIVELTEGRNLKDMTVGQLKDFYQELEKKA